MLSTVVNALTTPLSHAGYGLLHMRAMRARRKTGVSATAVAPLFTRYALDHIGVRPDPLATQVLYALPTTWTALLDRYISPLLRLQAKMSPRVVMLDPSLTRSIGPANMLAARTTFFDRTFQRGAANDNQLVILGAGFDTRAHHSGGRRVYEVDAPQTQATKQALMRELSVDDGHVEYVAVDFTKTRWLDALVDRGFDPTQPATVLWEGVSYYLPPADVDATLQMMGSLAPGSTLAFDYFAERFVHTPRFGLLWMVNRVLRMGGEPLRFGLDDPGDGSAVAVRLAAHRMALSEHVVFGAGSRLTGRFGGLAEAAVRAP